VFEPRRFVELRKQNFWKQVKSAESFGMGLFYTLNVFFIQFYLGAQQATLWAGTLSLHSWMLRMPWCCLVHPPAPHVHRCLLMLW